MSQLQALALSKSFNLILFNLLWAGSVIGRDSLLLLTIPVLAAYICFLVVVGAIRVHRLLMPAVLGITLDCALTATGVYAFSEAPFFIPIWLITLWFAFATTLPLSLTYLGRNRLLAAICGAFLLPFNYAVGERLGAVEFAEPYFLSVLLIGLVWLIALPLLFELAGQNA